MNFSYLDKEEYKDIKICDSDFMLEFSNNDKFYIRKYLRDTEGHALHRHKYIQINYVSSGKGYHIINNRKVEISKGWYSTSWRSNYTTRLQNRSRLPRSYNCGYQRRKVYNQSRRTNKIYKKCGVEKYLQFDLL